MEKDVSDNSNHKRAGVPMLTLNNTFKQKMLPDMKRGHLIMQKGSIS